MKSQSDENSQGARAGKNAPRRSDVSEMCCHGGASAREVTRHGRRVCRMICHASEVKERGEHTVFAMLKRPLPAGDAAAVDGSGGIFVPFEFSLSG